MKTPVDHPNSCIVRHIAGSRLYGTNHESSDFDEVEIVDEPLRSWIGFGGVETTTQQRLVETPDGHGEKYEITMYGIKKWLRLLHGCNPNIVESLFVPSSFIVGQDSERWNFLRDHALGLLSKRVYHTFNGYSSSQVHKLIVKNGNKTGRTEIVEQRGFDTKFAMHAIRIVEQGIELLTTGRITFPRPNARFLLDVRNGVVFGPNELNKCVDYITARTGELLLAYGRESSLPHSVDVSELENTLLAYFKKYVLPQMS